MLPGDDDGRYSRGRVIATRLRAESDFGRGPRVVVSGAGVCGGKGMRIVGGAESGGRLEALSQQSGEGQKCVAAVDVSNKVEPFDWSTSGSAFIRDLVTTYP